MAELIPIPHRVVAPAEREAVELYVTHLRDCIVCSTGAGWLCRVGAILHRRWAAAAALEVGE